MGWNRRFVANIYEEDYGEQFENPIEDAEDVLEGFETLTESYTPGNDESLNEALNYVTDDEEGYRTVLLTVDQWAMMDDIARVAAEKNVVGGGYVWAITGDALPLEQLRSLELEPGSPLDTLLDGAAVFTNWDRFLYPNKGGDTFMKAWQQQSVEHVNQISGRRPVTGDILLEDLPKDYFKTQNPVQYASFIYDSVMAVGLSACAAQKQSDISHVEMMKKMHFTGASGTVRFMKNDDGEPGPDRDPSGVVYGLHNVRPTAVQTNGKRK